MSAQLGLVCECVQGTPLFFFVCGRKNPTTNFKLLLRKKEKAREREKERRSQTEKKVSRVSHNSLPLCFVSAVVLKSNKAL